MKCTQFVNLLVTGLILGTSVVGCKKKPQNPTPLPGHGSAPITDDDAGKGIITPVTPPPPINRQPTINNQPPINVQPPIIPEPPIVQPPPPIKNVEPGGGAQTGAPRDAWIPDRETFRDETVYFDFDKHNVRASEVSKLQAVVTKFKGMTGKALRIEGHCDERGTEEYNRSLGERRALAVREKLVAFGLDASLIDTISHGEDQPVDPGHNDAAWSKNRRGEIVLLSPPPAP